MVLQNTQNSIEITSNMIYIVALGVGFKYPHKIHLYTQCPPCVDSFYTLSMYKNKKILNPSPPHLVHVIIEWPLTERICQTGERKKKRGLIMSSIIDNISRCQAINVETIDYDSKTTHILVSM